MGWGHQLGYILITTPERFFPHHSPVTKHSQGCQAALEVPPSTLCEPRLLRAQPELKRELVKIKGFYSYKVITAR